MTEPLSSKEDPEVARVFFKKLVFVHGTPKTVVTDQGKAFFNRIFKGMIDRLQVNHARITAYRTSANEIVERANYSE